jgi:hypothetical protein
MRQVVEIGVDGVAREIGVAAVAREAHPLARSGQHRWIDQSVVLQETDEDASQNPCGCNLGQVFAAPGLEKLSSALVLFGVVVFGTDTRVKVGIGALFLKITLKLPQQPFQVGQ